MKNIRIEEVGDIHSQYPYLEVFLKETSTPFLEVSILENKQLNFKLYPSKIDLNFNIEDWEFIFSTAKDFLPRALKNEDDFSKFSDG